MITFTVYGKPEPAGSKKSLVPLNRHGQPYRRQNGGVVVSTVDTNKNAKGWKAIVSLEARKAMLDAGLHELLSGPISFRLAFFVQRPKSHYGTGRNAGQLKASAPKYPTVKPDVLKMARGVEDALTKVVWHDDSQIVRESLGKDYGEPRVEIEIEELQPAEGARGKD